MGPEMEAKIKLICLGLILGAAVAMFIGFKWGGWSTSKTTQKMVEEAVLTKQGVICADQYMKHPNNKEKLKEFGGINSKQRTDFIEKGGWNKMPGQENADYGVSRTCVEALEDRLKK
jgi:hypothetical protein